jgi:hypothetical protein
LKLIGQEGSGGHHFRQHFGTNLEKGTPGASHQFKVGKVSGRVARFFFGA